MLALLTSALPQTDSQASQDKSAGKVDSEGKSIQFTGKEIVTDQFSLWTSPLRFRSKDFKWVIPTIGITAGLITQDKYLESQLGTSGASRWNTISNLGLATVVGSAASIYLAGHIKGDAHAKETGWLSGQAALNSFLVNTGIQAVSRRARPDDAHSGDFFVGGSSFPSDHSAIAWSVATVVAHEYPGWGTKMLAYGSASAVSLSRLGARKHFPSDVFVGSTLGWLIGNYTYHAHHNRKLPGEDIGDFKPAIEQIPNPMHQGTTYVPVDSWVYAAYDRLAALGYAPTGAQNLRPWSRLEFAQLLQEASTADPADNPEVGSLYAALQAEFSGDAQVLGGAKNVAMTLDSAYTRFTGISGPPLTDGFHFGQTIVNDYGRPYQEGFNAIAGATTHAEAGPFAFYVRGEYQHSPYAPALPDPVRTATAAADGLPVAPATPFSEINRFRLLEAYVTWNLSGWQFSFGKQILWWGPAPGQDLILSNNAEPMTMLRMTKVMPTKLPGLLRFIGPVKADTFLSQLDGYNFLRLGPDFQLTGSYQHRIDPQPYVWGYKISLQPTNNLQIGVSYTTVFAGLGRPLTFDTWFHTFSMSGNVQPVEPGDRRAGFDFSYRIPGLRRWLILYSGSITEDEYNPIAFPRRSAWNPGLYLPQVPGLRKLDLHLESAYTNLPNDPRANVFYTNNHYANGYTNNGQIMGGWIGPEAQGYLAWANYWLNGQSRIQFGFRAQTVSSSHVSGGRLYDGSATYDFQLRKDWRVQAGMQYEKWNFPVLSSTPKSNLAIFLQVTFQPRDFALRKE